jgi:hypothetical protein
VCILGTYGNELSNTSRHVLYYSKVLFFLNYENPIAFM